MIYYYKQNEYKKLSILVVNYNNLDYTRRCMHDLLFQKFQDFGIWLIDQGSTEEGTEDFLKQMEIYGVKVVRNSTNIYLNHVWNYFYGNCNSEYLCFLNNDVRLTNNYVGDTIKLLDNIQEVGIAIHVTNNLDYTQSKPHLMYEILRPRYFQGWEFTIKRSLYIPIPDVLKIFGGDDFLFAHINKLNYETGLIYSSPILHEKEATRNKMDKDFIKKMEVEDTKKNLKGELKKYGLVSLPPIYDSDKCNKKPPKEIKLKNYYE